MVDSSALYAQINTFDIEASSWPTEIVVKLVNRFQSKILKWQDISCNRKKKVKKKKQTKKNERTKSNNDTISVATFAEELRGLP